MQKNENFSGEQGNRDPNLYICPYCQKTFPKIEDLNLHVLTKHTGSYSLRSIPHEKPQDDAPATTSL
ncbi:MAG: C2H2-type zinc finger protein [Anaerolineae bacterium]